MEEIKKSYYAIIPAPVRYDEALVPNAKLLYGEISSLCNEKGYCWATNDYFAKLYHTTITSISKWISSLEEKNYIEREIIYRTGTKEIEARYLRIIKGGIQEKLKDNIKSEYLSKDKLNNFKKLEPNTLKIMEKVLPMNFQNRLPQEGKPITKTLYIIEKMFLSLTQKNFIRQYPIDPNWLEKNKEIDLNFLKSISSWEELERMLKLSIKRFILIKTEGYWPADKKYLPKSLSEFLYNPRTRKSWFLFCLFIRPKLLGNAVGDSIKDTLPDKPRARGEEFLQKHHPEWPQMIFWTNFKELYKWMLDNREQLGQRNTGYEFVCGNMNLMLEKFVEFEKDFTKGKNDLEVRCFNIKSQFWKTYFISYMKKKHGINLELPQRK